MPRLLFLLSVCFLASACYRSRAIGASATDGSIDASGPEPLLSSLRDLYELEITVLDASGASVRSGRDLLYTYPEEPVEEIPTWSAFGTRANLVLQLVDGVLYVGTPDALAAAGGFSRSTVSFPPENCLAPENEYLVRARASGIVDEDGDGRPELFSAELAIPEDTPLYVSAHPGGRVRLRATLDRRAPALTGAVPDGFGRARLSLDEVIVMPTGIPISSPAVLVHGTVRSVLTPPTFIDVYEWPDLLEWDTDYHAELLEPVTDWSGNVAAHAGFSWRTPPAPMRYVADGFETSAQHGDLTAGAQLVTAFASIPALSGRTSLLLPRGGALSGRLTIPSGATKLRATYRALSEGFFDVVTPTLQLRSSSEVRSPSNEATEDRGPMANPDPIYAYVHPRNELVVTLRPSEHGTVDVRLQLVDDDPCSDRSGSVLLIDDLVVE